MPAKRHRRTFGGIRKLPSGRFQAFYPGPDGLRRTADQTFASKTDADRWLAVVRSSLLTDTWRDPELGQERLGEYVNRWIAERPNLAPRTRYQYLHIHNRHIGPVIGDRLLKQLTQAGLRTWRSDLRASGVSDSSAAKAYRLLRTVLNTAVDDGILAVNPCRIPGGGVERPAERPTLTVDQVVALSKAVADRYEAMIMVTTFGSLRWGEVTALRRRDVDLDTGVVSVRSALVEVGGTTPVHGPTKTEAGVRTVTLPKQVVEVLARHMDRYVRSGRDAYLFTGNRELPLRRGNFNPVSGWKAATASIGVPELHFHDLRHTGNTLAARVPGTSTRDLMRRMGHDSMRAALIYQHLSSDSDSRVAAGLSDQLANVAGEITPETTNGPGSDGFGGVSARRGRAVSARRGFKCLQPSKPGRLAWSE